MIAWISALIVGTAIFVGIASKLFWPSLKDDNVVEEVSEHVIHSQTGMNVDLSPESPEK